MLRAGLRAELIEEAREQVAGLVGAEAKNVTFTSGATEANMLALTPALEVAGVKHWRDRLFVSAIEHPSVRSGGRFAADAIEELPVTRDGLLDLHALRPAVARAERPLVSVMLANNETGVIQPIREIAEIVHAADGVLHVDAVQGPGRIDCRIERPRRRPAEPVRAQARRAAGRRRAHSPRRHPYRRAADQGRRPGARHCAPEPRTLRPLPASARRRMMPQHQTDAGAHGDVARPVGSRPQGGHAGRGDFRRGRWRGCRIRLCSRFPASRPRPR